MNMTGLRTMLRGLSLTTLSSAAGRTIAGSNSERCWDREVVVIVRLLQTQVLDDGAEGERPGSRSADDDDHHAGQQPGEQRRVGRERAGRRRHGLLAGQAPAMASAGTISRNRPASIASPRVVLYQSVLPVRPPNAEPLLFGRRGERVGDLGEAVWAGVQDRRARPSRAGPRHAVKPRTASGTARM